TTEDLRPPAVDVGVHTANPPPARVQRRQREPGPPRTGATGTELGQRELPIIADVALAEDARDPLLAREHAGLVGEVGRAWVGGLGVREDGSRARARPAPELHGLHEARSVRHVRIADG